MGIEVSENFTGRKLTCVAGAWVATRVKVVTGTPDEDAAKDAAFEHADPHPKNNNMRCASRTVSPRGGPLSWTVTAEYRFGDVGRGAANPLDEPCVVHPDIEHESLPFEYDIDGNPVVNSAGDPYDPPDTRFVPIATFVIKRVVPFFDLSVALDVTDSINSADVDILNFGTASKGQAYCYYYRPCEGYTELAPYVWVETKIGVRGDAEDPWQPRRVDKGRWGWYLDKDNSPIKGRICDAAGNPVDFDVLIDKGQPIQRDPGFYILGLDGSVNDSIINPDEPAGIKTDSKYDNADITVLIGKQKDEADFSQIINGR